MGSDFDTIRQSTSFLAVPYYSLQRNASLTEKMERLRAAERERICDKIISSISRDEVMYEKRAGYIITCRKKRDNHVPSLISCLSFSNRNESDISMQEEKSSMDVFIGESITSLSQCLRKKFSSSQKDNEVCKKFLLEQCEVNEICDIAQIIPGRHKDHIEKIAEKPCTDILLCTANDTSFQLKIFHVERKCELHGKSTKRYREVLLELLICRSLKKLQMESNACTAGFAILLYAWCAQGPCISALVKADGKSCGNEKNNYSTYAFGNSNHIYTIFEEKYVNKSLSVFNLNNAYQAVAVFKQVACSIAVAENILNFEHRYLLLENIGIQSTHSHLMCYTLNSQQYYAPTTGLEVVIKDFSCSRLTYRDKFNEGVPIYSNLEENKRKFKEKEYRKIFLKMKNVLQNDWERFEPRTNIFWLECLVSKLLTKKYTCPENKLHQKSLKYLEKCMKKLQSCKSAEEFLQNWDSFSDQ